MRRLTLLVAPLIALLGACQSRGQLVLGVATDLSARDQIDKVSLVVTRRGDTVPTVQFDWSLSGIVAEDFRLPGSFNLYADDGQEPNFDVVIDGFLGTSTKPKVERTATLGIIKSDDLFVRLGLVASCETLGCPASLTCVEGQCVARYLDARRLPHYDPKLVTNIECDSGTHYIDTSSHLAMPVSGACSSGGSCREGTCLADPSTLPAFDSVPFTGGAADLFAPTAMSGSFFSVGDLDTPRYFGSATPLGDGRVLVVGGLATPTVDGSGAAVSGASIYDPAYAAFRRLANPPLALGGLTATLLNDGTVLLVGVAGGKASAMLFDGASESFVVIGPPNQARQFHTATLLQDGTVLLVGGLAGVATIATVNERYDATTRAFTVVKGAALASRYFHQANLLADGTVLVNGGFVSSSDGVQATVATERYQPATDDFAESASMTVPRAMHTTTLLSEGTLLAVGGFSSPQAGFANEDAEYLVTTASTPPAPPAAPPLARAAQQAVALGNDRILFIGGAGTFATTLAPGGGAYVYNPSTRAFDMLPTPALSRVAAFTSVITNTTDILIAGGVPPNAGGMLDAGINDAGMQLDIGLSEIGTPPDLIPGVCDPVDTASSGCPKKCSVAGQSSFDPSLVVGGVTGGPRCTNDMGILIALNGSCTPPQSTEDDNCVPGTVCMTDVLDHSPHCQLLCHSDTDCKQDAPRTRCAFIIAGTNVTNIVGVCMEPCNFGDQSACLDVAETDMGLSNGVSCHFEPNAATFGATPTTQGICRFDGGASLGQKCDETTEQTSCSNDTVCEAGTCQYMCSNQENNCGGSMCTPLIMGDTNGNGWCIQAM